MQKNNNLYLPNFLLDVLLNDEKDKRTEKNYQVFTYKTAKKIRFRKIVY